MTVRDVFGELTMRTWIVIGGIVVSLALVAMISFIPGVAGDPLWGNLPFLFVSSAYAAASGLLALRLPAGSRVRIEAFLLASGLIAYAVGDAVWLVSEISTGEPPPYPGVADLFYGPALYIPMAAGLFSALRAFGKLENSKRPYVVGATIAVVGVVALWFTVLTDIWQQADVSMAERMVSVAYPVADVLLLLAPAAALTVLLTDLGGMPLARPWWSIVLGAAVMAVADTIYVVQQVEDLYVTGSTLDVMWLAAFGLVLTGIARMLDVHSVKA